MKRLIVTFTVVLALALAGCASDPRPVVQAAVGRWDFPIVGELDALSVADLAAAIRTVPQPRIYLLRIVNHNKVEAEDVRFHRGTVTYQVIERVHGHWQATDHVAEQG